MKVKKFQGVSMPEAMKKVKKELGPNAVILNSKVVKAGGFMGMFKKNQTEVIAAVDPPEEYQAPARKKPEMAIPSENKESTSDIMKEIRQLKTMISRQENDQLPVEFQDIYEYLLKQEVEAELAKKLVEDLSVDNTQPSQGDRKDYFIQRFYKEMSKIPFGAPEIQKPFVHLVGPTGVGKTTTVAKLAADAVLNKKWKVAFITTDTYRIAAIDQLKTYAKILDIPLEVAYNLEDYAAARDKYKDFDLVLVDTAGRNFRDPEYVKELKSMIDFSKDTETHLVLSLTSKYSDMKDIYQQFKHIPIQSLIFTKADETASYGSAINMSVYNQVGISYITNGQNVPDDINEASALNIARKVLEGYDDE